MAATTATGLQSPVAVQFDSSGNLWVADEVNNRVLEFTFPLSTGQSATLVIGQGSFTTGTAATSADGLNHPFGVAFGYPGNLWVADLNNRRVLEFTPPFSTGQTATVVIGQPSFTTSASLSQPAMS